MSAAAAATNDTPPTNQPTALALEASVPQSTTATTELVNGEHAGLREISKQRREEITADGIRELSEKGERELESLGPSEVSAQEQSAPQETLLVMMETNLKMVQECKADLDNIDRTVARLAQGFASLNARILELIVEGKIDYVARLKGNTELMEGIASQKIWRHIQAIKIGIKDLSES